jgi:AcrR family transcriptional regulator
MNANVIEDSRSDTRTRILDEAERLFRHYGYGKTTVADIARELGMSPANVYRFFASKAAINEAIAERITDARIGAALRIANGPGSAEDRLRRVLIGEHRMTVEVLLDEKKVHEMVAVAMQEQWAVVRAYLDRMTNIIETIIADGVRSGEFRVENERLAAVCAKACFCSLTHPLVLASCLDGEHASAEEMAEFVFRALKA